MKNKRYSIEHYEEKTGKTFSKLIVAVNARNLSRKVKDAVHTYKIDLVSQKELAALLKKYDISRKEIQTRLMKKRMFE